VFAVFLEASKQGCELRRNLSARDDSRSRVILQRLLRGVGPGDPERVVVLGIKLIFCV
jgi:hypothetical protein